MNSSLENQHFTVKLCVKRPLSKGPKIGLQDQLLLNAGQKYCRMLQGEHSAILLTFINKLPCVIKIFVLSIFEWPFYTGYTVFEISVQNLDYLPYSVEVKKIIRLKWVN